MSSTLATGGKPDSLRWDKNTRIAACVAGTRFSMVLPGWLLVSGVTLVCCVVMAESVAGG